jgi:hypothetical protein
VSSLSGDYLKNLTVKVIQFVQKLGFKVTVIITDNNRVNQLMFKLYCESNHFIVNPDFQNLKER